MSRIHNTDMGYELKRASIKWCLRVCNNIFDSHFSLVLFLLTARNLSNLQRPMTPWDLDLCLRHSKRQKISKSGILDM